MPQELWTTHIKIVMSGWLLLLACGLLATRAAEAQCPWDHQVTELQSSCICAYNLLQQLSVQCDMVEYQVLLRALDKFGRSTSIDLLYVNNSTVRSLASGAFKHLKLTNLQLSSCKIRTVSPGAFDGLYGSLKNLYLQDNEIEDLPVESLRHMKNLTTLDVSKNRISKLPDNAFASLKSLTTLKLSDNNLTISRNAFNGLEDSLKNLNLKGTRQKKVPDAVRGLKTLAFLDLAQNGIHDLPGPGAAAIFEGLHSLTALNLERNVIQSVGGETFQAISDTLSSLSLLNNLLTDFPTAALRPLTELRVLDIGFNLLTELPGDSFLGNPSLTLLALDGNPLSTVPGEAVSHLNTTLRGLSLGGRFLHCDCRLRWVADWIRRGDLQVTSRERNPQFCGTPPRLADRSFYTIEPDELECAPTKPGVAEPVVEEELLEDVGDENMPEIGIGVGYVEPEVPSSSSSTTVSSSSVSTSTSSSRRTESTSNPSTSTSTSTSTTTTERPSTSRASRHPTTHRPESTTVRKGSVVLSRSTPWPTGGAAGGRPPLVLPPRASTQDVLVRSAHRQDSSVVIQWDSGTSNILGFRVVYRLFGDKSFKQGPPLEATEREFKIKNVPSQECIIVCVISLEEINVTPETVPYGQCREVRTVSSAANNMDKITIAASAAICGTVVIAVIIFVAASRRRSRKLHTLDGGMDRGKIPVVGGLPVACCPASSPGPLSSLATLNAFTSHKDWDQVSVYSNRSLGRPQHNNRLYHMERQGSMTRGCVGDDMRYNGKNTKTRSVADGQSQHSFSNNSGRYLNGNAFSSGLVSSRPELRQSRQSLAVSERMSRVSYPTGRRRSRGREQSGGGGGGGGGGVRPGSRYSTAGSTHTLNYCGDTSDNWTDHDMDIYMARNPTTRGGLVPL